MRRIIAVSAIFDRTFGGHYIQKTGCRNVIVSTPDLAVEACIYPEGSGLYTKYGEVSFSAPGVRITYFRTIWEFDKYLKEGLK